MDNFPKFLGLPTEIVLVCCILCLVWYHILVLFTVAFLFHLLSFLIIVHSNKHLWCFLGHVCDIYTCIEQEQKKQKLFLRLLS